MVVVASTDVRVFVVVVTGVREVVDVVGMREDCVEAEPESFGTVEEAVAGESDGVVSGRDGVAVEPAFPLSVEASLPAV